MEESYLSLPVSDQTVRVRMIDTSCTLNINAESFIDPVLPGQEVLEVPDQAFLIEHEASGQKLMFDLGIRKDYWNLPPIVLGRLAKGEAIPSLRVDLDVSEVLIQTGISLNEISTVVWSHYHWDHIGNIALFPASTSLVVGPGFSKHKSVMPGFPENPTSPIPSDSFTGRELREIDFSTTELSIGGFRAYDFFADGSFYLLDTPGHCVGHICGLARTTPGSNSTFIFLGGDICHFGGCFRPSHGIPLPEIVPPGVLDRSTFSSPPCPATLFTEYNCRAEDGYRGRSTPFHQISSTPNSAYIDPKLAQDSVRKLMDFDISPVVFIAIAHDPGLRKYLPSLATSPDYDLNDWKIRGWKMQCHWDWLNCVPKGSDPPNRPPQTKGFWRERRVWDKAQETLKCKSAGVNGTGL